MDTYINQDILSYLDIDSRVIVKRILGSDPDPTLAQELEGIVPEVYSIGDLNGGTRIWGATHDAWRVSRTI